MIQDKDVSPIIDALDEASGHLQSGLKDDAEQALLRARAIASSLMATLNGDGITVKSLDRTLVKSITPEMPYLIETDGRNLIFKIEGMPSFCMPKASLNFIYEKWSEHFVRASRAQIVSLGFIESIKKTKGGYHLSLKGTLGVIELSRRNYYDILSTINNR